MTSSMLASVDPGYQLTFSEAASPALTTVMHRRPWSSAVSAMAAADGLLDGLDVAMVAATETLKRAAT